MKFYADLPARRTRQLIADGLMAVWVIFWVWAGHALYGVVSSLAAPGRLLRDGGSNFSASMTEMAGKVNDLPVFGDAAANPLTSAAGAGTSLSNSGQGLIDAAHKLSLVLGWGVALAAIVPIGTLWLLMRWQFVRRASAAQHLIDSSADLDLFALRAMANQPLPRLARISDDPAGDWRRGDRVVIGKLADIELAASGLRTPQERRLDAEHSQR